MKQFYCHLTMLFASIILMNSCSQKATVNTRFEDPAAKLVNSNYENTLATTGISSSISDRPYEAAIYMIP